MNPDSALTAGQYAVIVFVFLVSAVMAVVARRATAGERG